MPTKFDSKSFNPQAFGHYVERVATNRQKLLFRVKLVRFMLVYLILAELMVLLPKTMTETQTLLLNTTTYEQGFVTASRMDSWTERSFSKNITAGVDFMDNVAAQIGDYKQDVKQAMLLAILSGIFSMKTTGTDAAVKAAKEFIEKHTFDITGNTNEEAFVGASTLNKAIQRACGDNKSIFSLVIMHSEVATNLENLRLLKYLTYTDKDGITRDLSVGSWNGRTVLIDDGMPTEDIAASGDNPAYTKYTTYILGSGSIILDDIGDSVPYEMSRDPKTNGGQDTLYVRDRYICGVDGISFEKPASLTASASNDDLSAGANWNIINDGKNVIPHKAIAIARIISRG